MAVNNTFRILEKFPEHSICEVCTESSRTIEWYNKWEPCIVLGRSRMYHNKVGVQLLNTGELIDGLYEMKTIQQLEDDLILAKVDYQDNKGSNNADQFYDRYVKAYNAYWSRVDPEVLKRNS